MLYAAGAKAIFGPGTRIEDSAKRVLEDPQGACLSPDETGRSAGACQSPV
jgi:hypothetical protein